MCQHFAAGPVDDRSEVDKATRHRHVGRVQRPPLIGALDGELSEPIDGTSRAQLLSVSDNPLLHSILLHLKSLSGFGVVLNTSPNVHGRAMVESSDDAIRDFLDSGIDFLAIEGVMVTRRDSATPRAS